MQINLTDGILWYIVFLYSTTCHEASHAWAALKLGDDTAFKGGQVSLSPWPHLRRAPVGMFVVPVVSWLAGGWIMGWASAPYGRDWAQKHPKRAALMAAAGPAANLALLLLAALLIRIGLEWSVFSAPFSIRADQIAVAGSSGWLAFAAHALSIIYSLNLLLLVFNLFPIPPLDGSNLPLLLLPEKLAVRAFSMMQMPVVRTIGIILIFRSSAFWYLPLLQASASLLCRGVQPH